MARRVTDIAVGGNKEALSVVAQQKYRNGGQGFCDWVEDHIKVPIYPEGDDIATWVYMRDLPPKKNPETNRGYDHIWKMQKEECMKALEMVDGRFLHRLVIFCWPRGEGKCECKGSKVLMYDGAIKKVEDVIVGDLLMGDDSTPREVLSLASGKEEMFEVVPMQGESKVVTVDHYLSLKRSNIKRKSRGTSDKPYADPKAGEIVDISVRDYQKQSKYFKEIHKLYKVPINWPEQDIPLDPYFLGMWLADGTATKPAITTMDCETVDYLTSFAGAQGVSVTVTRKKDNKASTYSLVTERGKENPLLNLLRKLNLCENKHIPQVYKINSREIRMQVLAGILDGDGYKNRNSMQIVQKSKVLTDDIAFLARSLGFNVLIKKSTKRIKSIGFKGEYYVIGITGDCSTIPLRVERRKCTPRRSDWKNHLVTGIREIKSAGVQEYYGFNISGNGRYVTGDFTVTHNSLLVVLIQLWKFFNWPRQTIVLGANSKDQTKFVHYDMMRDIIINSPNLYDAVGAKNVQDKEIRIKDADGAIRSVIKPISTASGIVSNITGYTFSEMFDMRNPKFFTQLDGSTRNIPNALGLIDSTVSDKGHILYSLYQSYINKKTNYLYFSYRHSDAGVQEDYWNPFMSTKQLEDYRAKFLDSEFARYFLNVWEAGSLHVFGKNLIDEIGYLGCDGKLLNHGDIITVHKRLDVLEGHLKITQEKGFSDRTDELLEEIDQQKSRMVYVDNLYRLENNYQQVQLVSAQQLTELGDRLNTDWSILAGIDLADPLAIRKKANSIMVLLAKGLPNSKIDPYLMSLDEKEMVEAKFCYFLIGFYKLSSNTPLVDVRKYLDIANLQYDGVDVVCGERYGLWDLATWTEANDVKFEAIYPNYERQRAAFNHLYTTLHLGLFKAPTIPIMGIKNQDDILREELAVFDHNTHTKWFGSPEKNEKYGRQDDSIYAIGWGMYGGRELGPEDFRDLNVLSTGSFGNMFQNKDVLGSY